MKRIFVGLVILLTQFTLSLPWDSLRWDILPFIQWPYSLLFATITSIILVSWFLNWSQLHYRLYGFYSRDSRLKESQTNEPIPGIWLITIGAVTYLLFWPPVAFVLMAITKTTPAESLIIVILAFSLVFGYIAQIVMPIAIALILWGTIRMFTHLTPKE